MIRMVRAGEPERQVKRQRAKSKSEERYLQEFLLTPQPRRSGIGDAH
jgi:hypothetical protein